MQMYRVKFANKTSSEMVDLGDVIVCASNQELACRMVADILSLPLSSTEMEVSRVKPSFYQISRKAVKQSIATYAAETVDAKHMSSATFPKADGDRDEWRWFVVEANAHVKAEDENEAISKLSRAVAREMSGEKQKGTVKELDIKCDRLDVHPRTPAVEKNALYTVRRIFQGGDART